MGFYRVRAWSPRVRVLRVHGKAGEEKAGLAGRGFHYGLGMLLPSGDKEVSLWSSGIPWDICGVFRPDGGGEGQLQRP